MSPFFRSLSLIFAFVLMLSASAQATGHGPGGYGNDGHGPDFWRVHNVASYDVLNVRYGPGVRYHIVDRLPHNARGVQLLGCQTISTSYGPANWCYVAWQGYERGWVNARFLREDNY
ncbi:SH3 domain-containing protein [Gymnodinialimonas sp. 2305UL16-5]|uniref:SH3 domain-containing protein n=1 Tax=Gymnodinialimonas mytili TaxID=3126503 RepID=UPI00309A906A